MPMQPKTSNPYLRELPPGMYGDPGAGTAAVSAATPIHFDPALGLDEHPHTTG